MAEPDAPAFTPVPGPAPKKEMTVREMMRSQTMNAVLGLLVGALLAGWIMYRVGYGDGMDDMCAQIFATSNGEYSC